MPKYTPAHIANFMLDKAEDEGRAVTQLKLQKLVYIAHGWALALDEELFSEPVLAWKHGPVVRSLYDEFKHYGTQPIDQRSVELDLDTFDFVEPRVPSGDKKVTLVLNRVWEIYKSFSGLAPQAKFYQYQPNLHKAG